MALQTANGNPPTNSLSMSEVNTELGNSATAQIALNDADVRGLIGKAPNATFGMFELYGASSSVGWIFLQPVNRYDNGHGSTTSFVRNSSTGDYYMLIQEITRGANRADTSDQTYPGNFELYRFNSSMVLQDTQGHGLHPVTTTYGNYFTNSAGSSYGNSLTDAKILLRGNSDIFILFGKYFPKIMNQYNYQNQHIPTISKFNQSDLNYESARWFQGIFPGKDMYAFGQSGTISGQSIQANLAYGREIDANYSSMFLDGNGKVTHLHTMSHQGDNSAKFHMVRMKTDPQYYDAWDGGVFYKISQPGTNAYFNANNHGAFFQGYAINTSTNQYFATSNINGSYCLFQDSSSRTDNNSTQGYNYFYTGITNKHGFKPSNSARPKKMIPDENGHPCIFGYGGLITSNGSQGDLGAWCIKHNASGAKTGETFLFTGNNWQGQGGRTGFFSDACFDSSGNCYMAGVSQISRNVDGNWHLRGVNGYSHETPYISWLVKFNSNNVYQWHKYFDNKDWNDSAGSSGFGTTFGNVYNKYVVIQDVSLDADENPVISGRIPLYVAGTPQYYLHYTPFSMQLPKDGSVSNGFVGTTGTLGSHTSASIGLKIGTFGGDGTSNSSQFYWANNNSNYSLYHTQHSTTNMSIEGYTFAPSIAQGNSSSNNTSYLPAFSRHTSEFWIGHSGHNNSGGNHNPTPYTLPSNHAQSGKHDF